jgi:hypothetical protein
VNTNATATVVGLVIAMFGPILVAIVGARLARSPGEIAPSLLAQAALLAIVAAVLLIVYRVTDLAGIVIVPLLTRANGP